MSVASSILERSADVTHAVHGDSMALLPMNVTVSGYVQDITADPVDKGSGRHPRPHTAQDSNERIVYVRKSELQGVDLNKIVSIAFGNSKYSVGHYVIDPVTPEVAFHTRITGTL